VAPIDFGARGAEPHDRPNICFSHQAHNCTNRSEISRARPDWLEAVAFQVRFELIERMNLFRGQRHGRDPSVRLLIISSVTSTMQTTSLVSHAKAQAN